jgi:hypothetical protein
MELQSRVRKTKYSWWVWMNEEAQDTPLVDATALHNWIRTGLGRLSRKKRHAAKDKVRWEY